MSWATGLILWLLFGIAAMWIYGEIAARFSRKDNEHDWLADRKRKIAQRGYESMIRNHREFK